MILQLPSDLRHRDQLRQVRNYVYDIYFSGEQDGRSPLSEQAKTLKNNEAAGLNLDFYAQVRAANAGTGYDDLDWTIVQVDGDQLQVVKKGLHLWVNPGIDLAMGALDQERRPGDTVSLRLPNFQFHGDYYAAIGNAGHPSTDQTRVAIYFHVSPDGAIALMQAFTSALNHQRCPFIFKLLTDPDTYSRYDAVILCIEQGHYSAARSILQAVYPDVRSHLRDPIPLFTKHLAPGIGLAEIPEDEHDFGLHRCQQVAQALLESTHPSARLAALRQGFDQQHLDWQHPYLNPGSGDRYHALDRPNVP